MITNVRDILINNSTFRTVLIIGILASIAGIVVVFAYSIGNSCADMYYCDYDPYYYNTCI